MSSSRRFKDDIRDMGDFSARLLQLRPVTFRYTQPAADGSRPLDFGLIAEEVAEVFPELAVTGADGRIETVGVSQAAGAAAERAAAPAACDRGAGGAAGRCSSRRGAEAVRRVKGARRSADVFSMPRAPRGPSCSPCRSPSRRQLAAAQPFGTLHWQLQPFCNRVTVTINQDGAHLHARRLRRPVRRGATGAARGHGGAEPGRHGRAWGSP